MEQVEEFPRWLQSYDNLRDWYDFQYGKLSGREKGHQFAADVSRLIRYTDLGGRGFKDPKLGPSSHDGGVDIILDHDDGSTLCVQSKYLVPGKDEFDRIISKFRNYFQERFSREGTPLLTYSGVATEDDPQICFQIVTLQRLDTIRKLYEESSLASLDFYRQLVDTDRIEIVDGQKLLKILRTIYKLANIQPAQFDLTFEQEPIAQGNVYIGILSSNELQGLYKQYRNALFLENIRPFLGAGDGTSQVNAAIVETAKHHPDQFLGRNNGVVFRARTVEVASDNQRTLRLTEASVVNGCQTTMCLALFAKPDEPCHVVAKVVATEKAWDVAKAANLQNVVNQFELEIAQSVRQQHVERIATDQSFRVVGLAGASELLDSMHRNEIRYDELRVLFIGLVSRKPNNIFRSHIDDLISDVMAWFDSQNLLVKLFSVQEAGVYAVEQTKKLLQQKGLDPRAGVSYQRYFKDDKASYRGFMTLLAAAAVSNVNPWEAENPEDRQRLTTDFLASTISVAEREPDLFAQYFRAAIRSVNGLVKADRDTERFMQTLNGYCRTANETRLIEEIQLDMIERRLESGL